MKNKIKVLLVDDEAELVSTLAERLQFRDIEAEWCSTEDGAIEFVKKQHFDIAVIDIKLPGITGFEIKKILLDIAPDLQCIFMTGHASENYFNKGCLEAGIKYYLLKPVDIDLLVETMKEIMQAGHGN